MRGGLVRAVVPARGLVAARGLDARAPVPRVLGVDEPIELPTVEEDAAAVGALVHVDAIALVGALVPCTSGRSVPCPRNGGRRVSSHPNSTPVVATRGNRTGEEGYWQTATGRPMGASVERSTAQTPGRLPPPSTTPGGADHGQGRGHGPGAVADIVDGNTLAVGGFGLCGVPIALIDALLEQAPADSPPSPTTAASTTRRSASCSTPAGSPARSAPSSAATRSCPGSTCPASWRIELTPQGTLAERLRAGGAGIPAFYTPTGVGTMVAEGGIPVRYDAEGTS